MVMQVQLYSITKEDVQRVFEKVIAEHKPRLPRNIYLDLNYLYNFHLDDAETIRKFCILGRYDLKAVLQWHQYCERWWADMTVVIDGRQIKPIKISQSLDRVVNEGMEQTALSWTGVGIAGFKFHAIGDGVVSEVLPSDKILVNELDRVDVTSDTNGGSVSRDGSTLYVIGNHPASTPQGNMSETGVFDDEDTTLDKMLDHSIFPDEIEHLLNQDLPGSTTIVWQCSS